MKTKRINNLEGVIDLTNDLIQQTLDGDLHPKKGNTSCRIIGVMLRSVALKRSRINDLKSNEKIHFIDDAKL